MLMLHRMPSPDTFPVEAEERFPELLKAWLEMNPDAVPNDRDYEDWAEAASMMVSMSRRGDVIRVPSSHAIRICGDDTGSPPARPGSPKAVMWGSFASSDAWSFPVDVDLAWNAREQVRTVQDYGRSRTFLDRAGRFFQIRDLDRASVQSALEELLASGTDEGFVKSRDKAFSMRFSLKDDGRTDMLGRPISLHGRMDGPDHDFSMRTMHREGEKACIYVQGAIEPTHEYRVFVVGDRVACGAGTIDRHVPCDSEGSFFDDRMEEIRGDGIVVRRPDLAAEYLGYATEYAVAWASEHGSECGYSLDLCIDGSTGRVLPIEMNPLANVGMYACDVERLLDAMLGVESRDDRP